MGETIQKVERESPPVHLKDTWFKAYTDGNLLMPLRYHGISLSLTSSLFKDKPHTWEEFVNAKFSPEQLQAIVKMAKGAHVSHKVGTYGALSSEQVFGDRIQNQLVDVKAIVYKNLLELFSNRNRAIRSDILTEMSSEKGNQVSGLLSKIMDLLQNNQEIKTIIVMQHNLLSRAIPADFSATLAQCRNELRDKLRQILVESNSGLENSALTSKLLEAYV